MVRFQILNLVVLLARTPSHLKRMFWRVSYLVKVFKIWKWSLTWPQ